MRALVLFITLLTLQLFNQTVTAATSPAVPLDLNESQTAVLAMPVDPLSSTMGVQQHVKLKLRKLSFKEKLLSRLLSLKAKMQMGNDGPTSHQRKLGRLSLIFAISATVLLLIPYAALGIASAIAVLSLPLAVAGLVLGLKSIKGNSQIAGLIGLILSGTLLLIFVLSMIILGIIIASSGWN